MPSNVTKHTLHLYTVWCILQLLYSFQIFVLNHLLNFQNMVCARVFDTFSKKKLHTLWTKEWFVSIHKLLYVTTQENTLTILCC